MNTLFQVIGSLGLFLFGMKLMSEGLQKLSGEKLRSIMRSMTGNRVKGVFSGLVVTSVVQSSSATTVLVVSFVNAGLLKLREAIGVIMGANLGTTTTAWIIAFLNVNFSLSKVALPIVGVGVILSFFKKDNCKFTGEFFTGFGLLFMGLDFLKSSVPDINAHPEILEFISTYGNMGMLSVFLFFVFGIFLTLIVQSSSVAMAITMTMAAKGWISFELAAAIVLGENIGTTITANIAAIKANFIAKRAAIAHTLFNVIGVVWMFLIFRHFLDLVMYIIPSADKLSDQMLKSTAENISNLSEENLNRALLQWRLALFHTMFNAANILLLLPFVPLIEKASCWILKANDKEESKNRVERLEYLAANMSEMGELAMLEAQKDLLKLSNISGDMFKGFMYVVQNSDKDLSKEVAQLKDLEEYSDSLSMALSNFLVNCASHELSSQSTNIIAKNMLIVPELEQMCDHSYKLIKKAMKRYKRHLSDHTLQSSAFVDFCTQMNDFIKFTDISLGCSNTEQSMLDIAISMRANLDKTRRALRREATSNMESQGVTPGGILFIEMLSSCERLTGCAMNILETLNPKSAE